MSLHNFEKDGSDHHPDPFIRGAEIILLVQVADKGNQVFIADAAVADTFSIRTIGSLE